MEPDATSGSAQRADSGALEVQAKRKGSPVPDKHVDSKRQRSDVADHIKAPATGQSSDANAKGKEKGKVDKDRPEKERRHKHKHGDSKSKHGSPRKKSSMHTITPERPDRDLRLPQKSSHSVSAEKEAGEIGSPPVQPKARHRSSSRERSRSSQHALHQANGVAREYRPSGQRPPLSPLRESSVRGSDSATNGSKQSPPPNFVTSGILAEVRQAAIKLQKRKEEEAKQAQQEQADVSLSRARGKHSPIVWKAELEDRRSPKRSRALTASERAIEELEAFKKGREDNEGPVAVKASPSPSHSGNDEPLDTHRSGSNDDVTLPTKSRWNIDDDDAKDEADEDAALKALNQHERQDLELQQQLDQGSEQSEGLEDISDFDRTRPDLNMLNPSRSVEQYSREYKINEGTYGVVHRAKDKATNTTCALKQIKMAEEKNGFPLSSIREINILLSLKHKNIVNVSEVVVGRHMDDIYMVMEYMEHDLKDLMNRKAEGFTIAEVKNLMEQLLRGVEYLHSNWVLHRDLKTSNILYNNQGQLKICDFGMARQFGSPLREYTYNVVTLLYRSIELLLGQKLYSTAVDMWSVGCIMAELITGDILFKGANELEQIEAILKIMGTPTEKDWPGFSQLPGVKQLKLNRYPRTLRSQIPEASKFDITNGLSEQGFDLLERLLCPNPSERITAAEALNHPWFKELPFRKEMHMMPTFADRGNVHSRRKATGAI